METTGAGELVILLHGIGGNRTNWRQQLDVIGAEFTAAAWDARGYGDSEDYDGALVFDDFARDLARVIDAFGKSAAHLVGVSMGGRIALDFYSKWPHRVTTLTLADTSVGNAQSNSASEIEAFLAIRKRPLLEGKTPREIAPAVLASLIGPDTDPQSQAQMTESLSALRKDSYLKTLETVTRHANFPPFEQIGVPVLVLVGEYDRIATPEYAQQMAQRIPGAAFSIIKGGSHISNMDRAETFNAALMGFLRQHAARPNTRPHIADTSKEPRDSIMKDA